MNDETKAPVCEAIGPRGIRCDGNHSPDSAAHVAEMFDGRLFYWLATPFAPARAPPPEEELDRALDDIFGAT